MADLTDLKEGLGGVWPDGVLETSWDDAEPLITPAQLKSVHLFGIPLVSAIRIGKLPPEVMNEPQLKTFIDRAAALVELETGIHIFPRKHVEKLAFDKAEYDSFGYMKLKNRPVSGLISLTVTPSNQQNIFQVPNDWIDIGLLRQGQLNLIPLTIALKSGTMVPLNAGPGGAAFLALFGHAPWIPSFFQVEYVSGFKEGVLPKQVNELIGVVAAMEILSLLATTFARSNSSSLSIDGTSQSVSTPGPDIYNTRLQHLAEKRKWLTKKLKNAYGLLIFSDNV